MRKYIIGLILLVGIGGFAIFTPKELKKPIKPKIPPTAELAPALNAPAGFFVDYFAKELPGARVLLFDGLGNLLVSQTSEGKISLLELRDGKVVYRSDFLTGLNHPHGLAIDPDDPFVLYFAEEDKISKVRMYSEGPIQKVIDLLGGGGHFTRTIGFGPDKRLYVSIGSSCDVCFEEEDNRAKIFSMKKDGSDFKEYARGLRNSVFFTWRDGKMFATEMGRDGLGDDLPPDEVNIVTNGKNYGWPICYGNNVHDTEFDKRIYVRNPCMLPFETPSFIDIPAHSSPLGLVFVTSTWPAEYTKDLLVAMHGTMNEKLNAGYKIVRYSMSWEEGPRVIGSDDFIIGFVNSKKEVIGRPVDITFGPDGALYISDDKAGVIYRVYHSE